MLSRAQVRSFYDRLGKKQDWQRFYEGRAIRDLLEQGAFEKAHAVFELGCGTGRFAEDLLAHYLPKSATYTCSDISTTMVALARRRLAKYGDRAEVLLTEGSPKLSLPASRFDRFISTYVIDLLPAEDIRVVLQEAGRILAPQGRLCLISLTHGFTPFSRVVIWLWRQVYGFNPSFVGGCRPMELLDFLCEKAWHMVYRKAVVAFGVPSEVVVACKQPCFIGEIPEGFSNDKAQKPSIVPGHAE